MSQKQQGKGASLRDRAVVNGAASVSALRASVPSAGDVWLGTLASADFDACELTFKIPDMGKPIAAGRYAIVPAAEFMDVIMRIQAAQAIEARRAETTGSACESAVGETDASDAALINDIFDKMAEVVAPLPGIPDAPGQHAGTRAIEPSDGDEQ